MKLLMPTARKVIAEVTFNHSLTGCQGEMVESEFSTFENEGTFITTI